MPDCIVHLHIPKTGGTSQRYVLFRTYGREQVFWYGLDDADMEIAPEPADLGHYVVIGGHRYISAYPESLDAIFMSVIREPVSRAVSLYSYYVKPQFAENQSRGRGRREQQRLTWLDKGMDELSLVRSLENCPEFRRQINNDQCRYLSRGDSTFKGVLETLRQVPALIGTVDSIPAMNSFLGELLQWGGVPSEQLNRSMPGSAGLILEEPGAEAALTELLGEDLELYRFVTEDHQGLFCSVDKSASMAPRLYPAAPSGQQPVDVQIFSKGYIGIQEDGTGATGLVVLNSSGLPVSREKYPEMALRVWPVDGKGDPVGDSALHQPLLAAIAPEEKSLVTLNVHLPAETLAVARSISIEFIVDSEELAGREPTLRGASASIVRI